MYVIHFQYEVINVGYVNMNEHKQNIICNINTTQWVTYKL